MESTEVKKRIMISQPMDGRTEQEIRATRSRVTEILEAQGYEIANSLFTDAWYAKEALTERGIKNMPLCFLAKSLDCMSTCDAVYFVREWESARGCKVEHAAAYAYGMEIIEEQ
jgi:hypothetical protein